MGSGFKMALGGALEGLGKAGFASIEQMRRDSIQEARLRFQGQENETAREARAQEAGLNRQHRSSEAEKARAFQEEQGEINRSFQRELTATREAGLNSRSNANSGGSGLSPSKRADMLADAYNSLVEQNAERELRGEERWTDAQMRQMAEEQVEWATGQAPRQPAAPSLEPSTPPQAPAGGVGPVAYATPKDVQAALHANKITFDEAKAILIDRFGFE